MPVFEDLQEKQSELIRKMVAASMFVAPEGATVPTTLTTGGAAEVQTITITGGPPTGGTFTLTFDGQTTAAIAYNATAAAVKTALEALSNIEVGDITTAGGPLPGTAVTVTFAGQYYGVDVPLMTANGAALTPSGTVTPTTSTASTPITLSALPSGYVDLGLVRKEDGYTFGNEWEMSETLSHGYADPTRRDILSSVSTVAFTAQETKRRVQEMFYNLDLSAVTPATTGEITFDKPLQLGTRYYRALFVGRDGAGPKTIYVGVLYPRAMISETGEQSGSEETEFGYPMTLTATPDSTLGTAIRYYFGGPGWRSLLTSMGYPAAA